MCAGSAGKSPVAGTAGGAVGHGVGERLEVVVARRAARLLHVEPVQQVGHVVHRAPVGGDEALEAELALEDVLQRVAVRAAVDVVDAVVGAHHRAGAGVDAGLERLQLGLVQRLLVDRDAGRRCGRSRSRSR